MFFSASILEAGGVALIFIASALIAFGQQSLQPDVCNQYCDISTWKTPLCYNSTQVPNTCNWQRLRICRPIPSTVVGADTCVTGAVNQRCNITSLDACGPLAPTEAEPRCGNSICEVGDKQTCPQDCAFWSDGVRSLNQTNGVYIDCPALDPLQRYFVLTFDDGPTEHTSRLLELLRDAGNKSATFFPVGSAMPLYPTVIKAMVEDGHIIGSHSYQHFNLSKMSRNELLDDTANFDEMANALAGYKPKFLRPPYGSITLDAIQVYNQSDVNMKVVGWNFDLQDYAKSSRAEDILEQLESMLIKHPGYTHVIYLGHDTARASVEIVPRLLDFFTFQGFRHTTLDNCLFGGTEFSLRVSTRSLEPKPVQRLVIPQGADDTVSAAMSRTLSTWLPPFVALLVAFQMNFPI